MSCMQPAACACRRTALHTVLAVLHACLLLEARLCLTAHAVLCYSLAAHRADGIHWLWQALAEDFADRAGGLVDLNERALTLRTGGLRGEDDDAGPRGGYQDGQYSGQRR